MRHLTLVSMLVFASVAQAADAGRGVAPQPRPRLAPEIIATLPGQAPKPVEPIADTTPNPVLTDAARAALPRTAVVEMAPYVVVEPKMKAPSEYDMLTPKGRVEVALKKRPGLKLFNFFGMNNGIALAMLEEDRAVERRREMAELMSLYLIK